MILSALGGTISGLLGSLATNVFNFFSQKEKNKHEIELIKARTQERIEEAKAHIQTLQIQSEIAQEKANSDIYQLSQKLGNRTAAPSQLIEKLFDSKWTVWLGSLLVFLLGMVDVIRAAIRPGVTIVLLLTTGYLTYQNIQFMQQNGNLITAGMVQMVIESIIYLTFTTISWWFGDRRMAKFINRLDDGNKKH